MAHWGTWRGLQHPRQLQATPKDEGILPTGPHAIHLWHRLGSSPTYQAESQSIHLSLIQQAHSGTSAAPTICPWGQEPPQLAGSFPKANGIMQYGELVKEISPSCSKGVPR